MYRSTKAAADIQDRTHGFVDRVLRTYAERYGAGELILRAGGTVVRVHLVAGEVAWIHQDGHGLQLVAGLAAGLDKPIEALREVIVQCCSDRLCFLEHLVERELAEREELRRLLVPLFRAPLRTLEAHGLRPQALFIPRPPPSAMPLSVSLDLLLTSRVARSPTLPAIDELVSELAVEVDLLGVTFGALPWTLRYSASLDEVGARRLLRRSLDRFGQPTGHVDQGLYVGERFSACLQRRPPYRLLLVSEGELIPGRLFYETGRLVDRFRTLVDGGAPTS